MRIGCCKSTPFQAPAPRPVRETGIARQANAFGAASCGWAACLLLALAGCGGGTTGDVDSVPLAPELPQLEGIVTDGVVVPNNMLQVTVKGNAGLARRADPRIDLVPGDYLASLDQLTGPYFLFAAGNEPFVDLYSVATGEGVANVTSLTTLIAAEVIGRDPAAYFASLPGESGFTDASEESIADAHVRVRRLLQRDYGLVVPNSLRDFITTPFRPVAGDPMFDTLAALSRRLTDRGTSVLELAQDVGRESGRCKLENVEIVSGGDADRLCPLTKSNEADENDASIAVMSFANQRGDVLSVRTRDAGVLGVALTFADGDTYACSDDACDGVELGVPDSDLTRLVSFGRARLMGAAGALVVDGELRSGEPGVVLPGIPCVSNFFYVVRADRSAEGVCANLDAFGMGYAGSSMPSGATQHIYTFDSMDPETFAANTTLQVVTEGGTVVSALVYDYTDDGTGVVPLFQCRDRDCPGVALGPVVIDSSLGVDIETRTVTLDGAQLAALLPDGSLSTTESATLEGRLTGLFFEDSSVPALADMPCAASTPAVEGQPSDQLQAVQVCAPDDTQGFPLLVTSVDGSSLTMVTQTLQTDGFGNFGSGSSVSVTIEGASVTSVAFTHQGRGSVRYACIQAACLGVTVSAPNGAGERSVTFDGMVLPEVGFLGLPGTRTATLEGSFVAPPP